MSEPFIGEIRAFPYIFTIGSSTGWLPCLGQELPILQYQALFSIITNTYLPAGNSPTQNTFFLPNLVGNVAVGVGAAPPPRGAITHALGTTGGTTAVTLTYQSVASHSHIVQKKTPTTGNTQKTSAPSATSDLDTLVIAANNGPLLDVVTDPTLMNTALAAGMLAPSGAPAPAPHDNVQPFLASIMCIAYMGVYPIRP